MYKSLVIAACCVTLTCSALAQDVADAQPELEPEDRQEQEYRQRIAEMQQLLIQLQADQDDEQGEQDADAAEQRLRELLQAHQIKLGEPRRVPGGQLGGLAGILVNGELLEVETYQMPYSQLTVNEVVTLLDDWDYQVREAAETRLLLDNTLSRAKVGELVAKSQSPEQRNRLLRIAEHHVLREVREQEFSKQDADEPDVEGFARFHAPRDSAAVGFSYQPVVPDDQANADTPAVLVTATMPGFPGHAVLRPGDLVVAVDGQQAGNIRFRDRITEWMSNRIGFRKPGDTIRLTIVRQGQAIEVTLTCAQSSALRQMYRNNHRNAPFRSPAYTNHWLEARRSMVQAVPKPVALTPTP